MFEKLKAWYGRLLAGVIGWDESLACTTSCEGQADDSVAGDADDRLVYSCVGGTLTCSYPLGDMTAPIPFTLDYQRYSGVCPFLVGDTMTQGAAKVFAQAVFLPLYGVDGVCLYDPMLDRPN